MSKFYLLKTPEITLKGKNRKFFENILISNIKKKFKESLISIENWGGEFFVEINENENNFSKIFGISKILKLVKIVRNLDEIIDFLKNKYFLNNIGVSLKVKRKEKDYKLNSLEIYQYVKVNLKKYFTNHYNTAKEIEIIYHKKQFFIFELAEFGKGGLPVGVSGKGLVLISTGFDSPVASFFAMRRGLKLTFLHFHSYPQTSIQDIEKIKSIIEILNEYNLGSKLYLMNILEIQKFYFKNIPTNYLVLFYRRTMFRLADKLAKELGIKVLITGENLGQVASQTIENMLTIERVTDLLILRPLIGFDKLEIINYARKIGTEKISKLPGEDCCTLFVPKHPVIKSDIEEIEKIEKPLIDKIKNLEAQIYKEKEIIKFN